MKHLEAIAEELNAVINTRGWALTEYAAAQEFADEAWRDMRHAADQGHAVNFGIAHMFAVRREYTVTHLRRLVAWWDAHPTMNATRAADRQAAWGHIVCDCGDWQVKAPERTLHGIAVEIADQVAALGVLCQERKLAAQTARKAET